MQVEQSSVSEKEFFGGIIMRKHACLIGMIGFLSLSVTLARAASTESVGAAANWASHAGAADESGYSQLDEINASNVGKLGLAWALNLPGEVTLEATPLAVDGVLYFTGSYSAVYAVDATTGKLLWKYDPQIWKVSPEKMNLNFAVNRGAAYADGRVFAAALDGRLFALDAKSGKLLWTALTVDKRSMHFSTGAPRTFNGKVIIGNGGGDFGMRGYVTAYDAATGRQVWRFYTVPGSPEENKGDPAMERAAATWSGKYWNTGTGGTPWNGFTFDAELNRLYIGTGNGAPYDVAKRSPGDGDNLYLASIVAVDADTGKYIWHYQTTPREAWDYKCTANIVMATIPVDGKPRKVLMQSPTNGFFYVLDRRTGKLLSAEKTGKVTWADHIDLKTGRPVEAKNIRYENGDTMIWPSPIGTHNWQDMSFSPRSGLVYIPYMQVGAHFSRGAPWPGSVSIGGLSIGWAPMTDPEDGKGALLAWDPVHQKAQWKVQLDTIWNGGTLATAGDLVFQGTADGYLSAYEAASGQRVWHFNAGLGIIAAPISYAAQGKQYVSVLVGYGGSASIGSSIMHAGWRYGAQPRTLLTFAVDGKAVLPPSAPPDMRVRAVDDPSLKLNDADVEAGRNIFLGCAVCHGRDLQSAGGPAPDLRESQLALNPDSFWAVVHDGVLLERGMPRFDTLTREQAMQIFAYIRSGARQALAANKAQDKKP
jgi:quinohemoprotein ethanol dehydrogenase